MSTQALAREMADRASLFHRLVDRFGVELIDTVAQWTIDSTRSRLEGAELERRDLQAVMDLLWSQMVEGTEFEVVEHTDRILKLRVSKCLFADEMTRLDAADIGNAFYCAYDHGFCQGLNSEIRFTRTQTLMTGDKCCDHTYELGEVP